MNKKTKKVTNSHEIMNRHVVACKKAFAEACREMMLAVAMLAPDEPAVVKKPAPKKQVAKKPVQKPQPKQVKKQDDVKAEPAKPQPPLTPHTRTPKSVRLTPHEITLNLGSFNVKALADRDAQEFLSHPNVFWYRGAMFPDPRRYGVQPSCESARVVKRQDKKFANSPWTVSVTVHVAGDDRKCDSWGVGVYTRNKDDQE
jgi:hypothetical protein